MTPRRWLPAAAPLAALLALAAPSLAAPPALLQQISSDPFSGDGGQHATQVEPDTFSFGTTVVAAFQSGRFFSGGGASGISFATSIDGGQTWNTTGHLPGLTVATGGTAHRATDPSVAYDPELGVWLIASLTLTDPGPVTSYVVSRSTDGGFTWSAPVVASPVNPTPPPALAHDKGWIACDTTATSPHYGNCYLAFSDLENGRLSVVRSSDGGANWGSAVGSADNAGGLGVQPVVQPDGDVIIPYLLGAATNQIRSFRSVDGGATFLTSVLAANNVVAHRPTDMRALPVPSAEIDGAGTVYVAWHDCRFRGPGCSGAFATALNDIVYVTSADGQSWGPVQRVPIDRTDSGVDHFIPGLGVDPGTSGADANLGLAYYFFPNGACISATCQLNVGFLSSKNAGTRWSKPKTLNATPMMLSWLPDTSGLGRMVGDYISTSFVPGSSNAVPVVSVALGAPVGGTFSQSMWAARIRVQNP